VPHMCRRIVAPRVILVERRGTYDGKKRLIAYLPDTEGGNTSFRVTRVVIWAAAWWRLVFFLLPFFSLSHASIYMQSFEKFNCVLQFVFVLGLILILFISIFVRFDASLSLFCFEFCLYSFNLIRFFFYPIWSSFFLLLFFFIMSLGVWFNFIWFPISVLIFYCFFLSFFSFILFFLI
jgi:hypothetical protein